MKRSEMLDVMIEVSKSFNGEKMYLNNFHERIMEAILTVQEKEGMLPPERKATTKDFSNIENQKFLDDHDFKVNGWEPEDD